ncbi:MAG: hypothetical protein Q8P18_34605 [Pseudomonadota bacterium]|nr:hypothetical protein [Pseudomonadota bacterium]
MFGIPLLISTLSMSACQDPPSPAPLPSSTGSTAPWVEWRAADAAVRGPVALVIDRPGGPLDRLVADPDVTTFLNDRFHPLFRVESPLDTGAGGQPVGTVRFYDGCGCPLTPPLRPETPAAFIAAANEVIVRAEALACQGRPFLLACGSPPLRAPD